MGWLSRRSSFDKARLTKVLGGYELPSFPSAVHEVLRLLRDEDTTNAEIARALEVDPGMSVRLMRAVNSAVFGLRQPAEDLEQAIGLIGRTSVESMLLAAAVARALPARPGAGFDARFFWRTAALRAAVAGGLAARLCRSERPLCWTAGLLQDLAVPMLLDALGDRYGAVLVRARTEGKSLELVERDAFGWDHADIGAAVAERWELPASLGAAIAGHHDAAAAEPGTPADRDDDGVPVPIRAVAHLEPGDGDAGLAERLAPAQARFGLEPAVVEDAVATAEEDAERFAALVG